MTIHDRIRELRVERGMSQLELAQAVGYKGRSAICKVEKGERDISQSMIVKYAAVFGVSPAYLLYGVEDEPSVKPLSPQDIEFLKLISELSDDEKKMIIAQIKGILASR